MRGLATSTLLLGALLGSPASTPAADPQGAPSTATCAATLPSTMATTDGAAQLLTVVAATPTSSTAVLTAWTRHGACWSASLGPWLVRVGVHGVRRRKREGDGATPLGLFSVYSTIYGNGPNPGVHGTYRRLHCGDWWDEDVASPTYNSFRQVPCSEAAPPFANGVSEPLWESPVAYAAFLVIGYNTARVPGRGSGTFLHASFGRATTGCVALARPLLDRVLVWLRMRPAPRVAIATHSAIASL